MKYQSATSHVSAERFAVPEGLRRPGSRPRRIGFLYVGGAHQVYHTAPVAAALARAGGFEVCGYAASQAEATTFARIVRALGAGDVRVALLPLPRALAPLAQLGVMSRKKLRILAALPRLMRLDAIVTAERTSSFLAALPAGPQLIHIPHGAGDRARGFEKRMRRFDHVIVAGIKDRARLIGEGIVAPDRCSVSGYVKLDGLRALHGATPRRIFRNDRPVILYNPHHEPALSSWETCGAAVIDAFAAQDRYNLIVAPHVRLFERAGADARARWLARAVPDRIHIDLGSEASCDMSYTMLADAYVGDVSSQVYEFVADPRPCVFLNPHGFAWHDDPNFACWHFGPVIRDAANLIGTIEQARHAHPGYAAMQHQAARRALGGTGEGCAADAAARAAAIVGSLVRDPSIARAGMAAPA